jgi:hypothetical protein
MSLLQKKETSSAADGRDGSQKKQRMMSILQAIEQTPCSASVEKAAKPTDAEASITAEDENFTTTLSEIDRLISDVVAEKEVVTVVLDKGKNIEETSSEGVNFDRRHLGGQCSGTSQVIRPTYSCPCPTDLKHPRRCT